VFEMPVEIAVMTTGGEERFRVQNNARDQVFHLTVAAEPVSVTIDPDNWILRGDISTGVANATPSLLGITSLSPNPARNAVTVQFRTGGPDAVAIEVFDVAGRRVLAREAGSAGGVGVETIDTSRLAGGVYFLRVSTPTTRDARKFVVVR